MSLHGFNGLHAAGEDVADDVAWATHLAAADAAGRLDVVWSRS